MINQERLEIAITLSDPTDYSAFVKACEVAGKEPLPLGEYAQKIGMVLVGMRMFPESTPKEAYLKLIEIMNSAYKAEGLAPSLDKTVVPVQIVLKSCCGGGRVL